MTVFTGVVVLLKLAFTDLLSDAISTVFSDDLSEGLSDDFTLLSNLLSVELSIL